MICAYVDSSWKKSVAGFGVLIIDGVKSKVFSNYIPADNNNYGELWAIYQAAIFLAHRPGAVIYTDSQTAVSYVNDYIKDKERTPEQYHQHMHMKVLAYQIRRLGVRCQFVKGHKDCIENEIADKLARQGRLKAHLTNQK